MNDHTNTKNKTVVTLSCSDEFLDNKELKWILVTKLEYSYTKIFFVITITWENWNIDTFLLL